MMQKILGAETVGSWSRRRTAQVVLALLLAIGVGGCTKLVYNRLDTLAGWYLGTLVSLDEDQRMDLRSWLQQTLAWHRESELTRYAQFLRELAAEASQPGNRIAYERAEQRIEKFGGDLVAKAAPEVAQLLMRLSPVQVAELEKNLQERSYERSEDNREAIADGTWHKKRTRETQRQVKRWTGAVTAQQKLLVQQAVLKLEPTTQDWLESQHRWRTALQQALSARDSRETAEQGILQLLREPDSEWTSEYKAKSERNREQILALTEALDASLTQAQRERLQRELTELAEQLEALTEDN